MAMKKRAWLVALFTLAAFAACSGRGSLPPGSGPTQPEAALQPQPQATTASYASVVLSNSPSQYYPLNESSGPTAYDKSTARVNGTYAGSVTYGQTGPLLHEPSTAVSLPGHKVTAYVSLP